MFAKVFKPEEGDLWAYYNAALASRVPRKDDTYALAKTGTADRTAYNPAIVGFLNRASDLTTVLFPTGHDSMLVEFDAWIDDNPQVAVTTFEIDGAKIEHANGPGRWQRLKWPGEGDSKGGFITARNKMVRGSVEREGNWGFFELLLSGTLKSGSGSTDVFAVQWDLRDQEAGIVTIKFRPLEADNPFFGTQARPVDFMQVFRHPDLLHPPAQILLGGTTCSG